MSWSPVLEWDVEWPPKAEAPYRVQLRAQLVGDRYEVVRVVVDGTMTGFDAVPVRTEDLRLPLRALLDSKLREVRAEVAEGVEGPFAEAWAAAVMATARRVLTSGQPPRPGRPRSHGPDHFRQVALVYATALRAGLHPTKAVAEEFSVSGSAAARWVSRCRQPDLGLLPPTTRGAPKAHPATEED